MLRAKEEQKRQRRETARNVRTANAQRARMMAGGSQMATRAFLHATGYAVAGIGGIAGLMCWWLGASSAGEFSNKFRAKLTGGLDPIRKEYNEKVTPHRNFKLKTFSEEVEMLEQAKLNHEIAEFKAKYEPQLAAVDSALKKVVPTSPNKPAARDGD